MNRIDNLLKAEYEFIEALYDSDYFECDHLMGYNRKIILRLSFKSNCNKYNDVNRIKKEVIECN